MKEQFKLYLKNQLEMNEKMLSTNSLSEEDKAMVEQTIANLNSTIEAVDALEGENNEAVEALRTSIETINDSIKAIQEKLQQKQEEITPETMENNEYLKSQNSVHDFCDAVRATKDSRKFAAAWGEMLTKNSISFETGAETYYLPEFVKAKIQDAWEKDFPFLAKLNKVNAKQYVIRWNNSDQDDETSRAKGHKKGETKVEEAISFDAKTVVAKCIYKLQVLDNETIWNDDSSLLDYILNECLTQWHYEVAKSVLVGDGRSSATPDLRVMGIKSIARSTTDDFVTVGTRDAVTYPFLLDELVKMRENIKIMDGQNDIMLFLSTSDINSLRRIQASATSTPVYMELSQIADMIGVAEIVPCDYLGSTYEAIMFRPSKYVVVGENNPAMAHDEDIKKNQQIWRYEAYIGGDVEGLHSASVLKFA